MGGIGYTNGHGLAADLDFSGTEVIREYDGWADEPDDKSNLLAVINAQIGRQTLHTDYEDVDLDSEKNVKIVEYYCNDGATPCDETNAKSSVTYVWVPTDTRPLVIWTGPFAPALDDMLRPIVDGAYTGRPTIPDPTPPAAEPNVVAERTDTNPIEATKANLLFSVKPTKPVGNGADSVNRAFGSGSRNSPSSRPVRDAITTAKKVIDHIADRVTRTDKGNDGERADAEN